VKRFIAGIKIPRLADRISSEAKTAGKKDNLTFVMQQSLTEMDDMISIRDEVRAHPESFGIFPSGKRRHSVPDQRLTGMGRSKPRKGCFICGKLGHKAVDCWDKDKKKQAKAISVPSTSKLSSKPQPKYLDFILSSGEVISKEILLDTG
ncbi:hypothetical protein ADUPG1_003939, partial [Aduncisulcus paluster]